ncbi:MAG TPA: ATP-binding cassette domain-containing protein, partial [Actinoplanes sp.]|nr:ATP-binding cassette domain-containing protein [Actinoplanes sp.]
MALDHVGKIYPDGTVAIGDLSLRVSAGELTVLLGRPGSGKSTALQMINRLVEPTKGQVLLDGTDVAAADPVELRRRIGYVVTDAGLFGHQSVRTNVGTVPRLLGWKRKTIQARSDEM